jgi:hypothetical protein
MNRIIEKYSSQLRNFNNYNLLCLFSILNVLNFLYDSGGFGRVVNGLKRGDTLPILVFSIHDKSLKG